MSLALTSPITGSAQTGFTSPTYTLVSDIAPDINGKQYIVSALGGTQTGASVHTVQSPFTVSMWRPRVLRTPNFPVNGSNYITNNPINKWKVITRKGGLPTSSERPQVAVLTSSFDIPAGLETYGIAEMRAMISCHIGALTQMSAALGDSVNNGTL